MTSKDIRFTLFLLDEFFTWIHSQREMHGDVDNGMYSGGTAGAR